MKTILSKSFSQKNDLVQNQNDVSTICRQNSKCQLKKFFSRKPETTLKVNQNSSKTNLNKIKIKKQQEKFQIESNQSETRLKKLLNQSMKLKFVSPKNSKSLEKLFLSSSMGQLLNSSIELKNNQISQIQTFEHFKKNKAQSFSNKNFNFNARLDKQSLQTIIDSQDYSLQCGFKKRAKTFLMQKDDQTKCHQTTQESPREAQCQGFDFASSEMIFSRVCEKQCFECLKLKDHIKILSQKNISLQSALAEKQKQIHRLNVEFQNLTLIKKQIEDSKTKIQRQMSQNKNIFFTQKEAIEKQFKSLKYFHNKVLQDLKYKQIQNNVNKRYRKQCFDLNEKIKVLEEKVQQYKIKISKFKAYRCQKCQFLKLTSSVSNLRKRNQNSLKKDQKRQKIRLHSINKKYSQDTIFSLSLTSEQDD